jgi:hypothetical protein
VRQRRRGEQRQCGHDAESPAERHGLISFAP